MNENVPDTVSIPWSEPSTRLPYKGRKIERVDNSYTGSNPSEDLGSSAVSKSVKIEVINQPPEDSSE